MSRKKLAFGRYDYAAYLAFGSYAMCGMAIPMCLVPLAADLGFPLEDGGKGLGGLLQVGRSVPMMAAMLLCGFMAGIWGKRRSLGASLVCMSAGISLCALAPSYGVLFGVLIVAGFGEGIIEGLATPFIQDLHPDEPGRYLNFTHAFWSIGVAALVLGAGALLEAGVSWRWIMVLCGIVSLVPAALLLIPGKKRTPMSERFVRVPWRNTWNDAVAIMRERRFWLFFAAMFFAGGADFCLTFWSASFIQLEYGGSAWTAGLGTAIFSGGMIVGRIGSGWLVGQNGLKPLVVVLAIIGAGLSMLFPMLQSVNTLFLMLFLTGAAVGPFWPSIQSDGAQRVKGDYTMMMILFSCSGIPGCGIFAYLIGLLGDHVGLRASFYIIPFCFVGVFLLMGYDLLTMRREKAARESAV